MVVLSGEDLHDSSTFGKSLSLRVDGGFNAVSINPSGRDVVLAGRKGLFIIDLDDPFSPPRLLQHVTPWQVADVQWSPHPAKPFWVVSTSNQKALIWNLARPSTDAIEHVLHSHSRAITDINFNFQHPDILATCSIDTYVHAWDLRSTSRPFYTTSAWRSGASQVKWNHMNSNILASSHGNELFIWDIRKGCIPLKKLDASSSINNIDFNRFNETEIMTSGNNGEVRIWDYSKSEGSECQRIINTDFPVWRSRYLPFGRGFCVMPMVGGNNTVYMMNLDTEESEDSHKSKLQPIYTFKGHTDRVTDFLWRSRYTEDNGMEYQLVTWSIDRDLRLWTVNDTVYEKLGYDRKLNRNTVINQYKYQSYNKVISPAHETGKGYYDRIKENFVSKSGLRKDNNFSHLTWLSGIRLNQNGPSEDLFVAHKLQSLGEEVSAIGHKFPKIVFERILVSEREITVTMSGPWSEDDPEEYIFLRITVNFPLGYPDAGNSPTFTVEENPKLKPTMKSKLLDGLSNIAKIYTDKSIYCLEPCFRYVLGEDVNLQEIEQDEEPLLNFEIADHLDFDGFENEKSTDIDSNYLDESSSESDIADYSDDLDPLAGPKKVFQHNVKFDSTPVPNQCGAVWTSSGQLLCFFASEGTPEKKQQNLMKYMQRDIIRHHKVSDYSLNKAPPKGLKLLKQSTQDTESAKDDSSLKLDVDSQNNSDDSYDSFEDDWDDILRNDIVVRNKFPVLQTSFPKAFNSLHSESAKTAESIKVNKNLISLVDFNYLIPDKRELALEYRVMDALPEELARQNALIAEKYGFEDITHCWQILSDFLLSQETDDPYTFIWDNDPMTIKWFVKEAVSYFEKCKNVQMLAMIYCIICNKRMQRMRKRSQEERIEDAGNALGVISYEAVRNGDKMNGNTSRSISSSGFTRNSNDRMPIKKLHSPDVSSISSGDYFIHNHNWNRNRLPDTNSPLSNRQLNNNGVDSSAITTFLPEITIQLIDDDVLEAVNDPLYNFFDEAEERKLKHYVLQYSSLLYQWNLPIERVKVLKASTIKKEEDRYLTNYTEEVGIEWVRNDCGREGLNRCTYCHLKAQYSIFVCGNCQHVLHLKCSKEWWNVSKECPTGCGCNCPNMFDVG